MDSLEGAEAIKLKFKEEEIYTLARARSLTEQDLEKLGFKMGKRKDILEALHRMLIQAYPLLAHYSHHLAAASGPAPVQPSGACPPFVVLRALCT